MEQTGWQRIDELFEAARLLPAGERDAFLAGATGDAKLRAEVLALLHEHDTDPWFVDEPSAPPLEAPPGPAPAAGSPRTPTQAGPAPAPAGRPAAPTPGDPWASTSGDVVVPSPQSAGGSRAPREEPPAALVPGAPPRSPSPGSVRPGSPAPPRPAQRPLPPASAAPHATPPGPSRKPLPPSTSVAPAANAAPRPTPVSRERLGEAFDAPPELAPGARFGAYRIVRQIGRGSMGAVYEATYQSGTSPQRLSLRVLPRGWSTAGWTDWFRAACHLVAGLDHPWIARLVDGGVAEDGTPFVATEHVAGEEIDAWCRSRDVTLEDRVRLVLRVCTALEYAHQRLVVHRSVAPKNVVVTADGQPRLLNCGVARLLFGRPDTGEGLTRTGQSLFTPEYTSPEQVRGDLMTAASDIYALGVLLYVLFTDHPPYELRDLTPPQMKQVICERDPELPSRVVPASQRRALANELDAIVMKALRKDPRMRYLSVTALADDLHAWLDGRPVAACPGGRCRRASRLLRRHWLASAAAGVAVIALIAAAALFGWQARSLRAERDRAEGRLAASQRFSQSLLGDLHGTIAGLPESASSRKALLSRAVEYTDALARDAGGDPAAARELAGAYRRLAALQVATPGEPPAGRAEAARSLDAAVAAGERGLAADPRSVDVAVALTEACGELAVLRLALGEREAADRADDRHRELVERLARDHPRDVRARAAASAGYARVGAFHTETGDPAGARVMYAYAVAGFERLAAEGSLPDQTRRDYARGLRALGAFLLQDGLMDEAGTRLAAAQALDREDLARRPGEAALRRDLAASTSGLARVARRRGDNARAESLWTQALADAQGAADAGGAEAAATAIVADARASLAELCRSQRRLDEALTHAREAVRARERLAGAPGAAGTAALDLAVARTAVAMVQLDVIDARPSSPNEEWRLRDAGALLTQAFPVVRDAAASAAQQAALEEINRQTARFRRLTAARQ